MRLLKLLLVLTWWWTLLTWVCVRLGVSSLSGAITTRSVWNLCMSVGLVLCRLASPMTRKLLGLCIGVSILLMWSRDRVLVKMLGILLTWC